MYDLNEFREFFDNYKFQELEINEKDGLLYCNGECLTDIEGNTIGEGETFINAGSNHTGALAKLLSNFSHFEFTFRGVKLNSLESFFQGIKFEDIDTQNEVFKYSGKECFRLKSINPYDWRETGDLFFQGRRVNRFSEEYKDMVIELYFSILNNPLYRLLLLKVDKPIIHSIGNNNPYETVFTRYEFEYTLNALKEYVHIKEKTKDNEKKI